MLEGSLPPPLFFLALVNWEHGGTNKLVETAAVQV